LNNSTHGTPPTGMNYGAGILYWIVQNNGSTIGCHNSNPNIWKICHKKVTIDTKTLTAKEVATLAPSQTQNLTVDQVLAIPKDKVLADFLWRNFQNKFNLLPRKVQYQVFNKMKPTRKTAINAIMKEKQAQKKIAVTKALWKKTSASGVTINLPKGSFIYPYGKSGYWSNSALTFNNKNRAVGPLPEYMIKYKGKITKNISMKPERRNADSIVFNLSKILKNSNVIMQPPITIDFRFQLKNQWYLWKKQIQNINSPQNYTIKISDSKKEKAPVKANL
jgi:hypothetical protein